MRSLSKFITLLAVIALHTPIPVCGAPYTANTGDTVCGIGIQCGVELHNLLDDNPRTSSWDNLQQENAVQMPSATSYDVQRSSCSECAQAGPTKNSTMPTPVATKSDKTYTVVAGDTASEIAAHFGISLEALEAANPTKVADWNLLQIGLILDIPSTYPGTSTSMATASGIAPSSTLQYPSPPASLTLPPPPAATAASVWTVSSGDTGNSIASIVSVPFSDISTANPTVVWTQLSPGQTLTIPPAPTSLSQVTAAAAVHTIDLDEGATSVKSTYTFHSGDGSAAEGWPQISDWPSFNVLFNNVKPYLGQNCVDNVPGNSPDETNQVREAILSVAKQTYMDPRFILAVVMQESNGCVRVVTTAGGNSNPGLMQSFEGKGSCNRDGQLLSPCPDSIIRQMIVDGTAASIDGITLVKALNQAINTGITDLAQGFYRAARLYNSGASSLPANGDLGGAPGATLCYSSDIANRLMGWVDGPTACYLHARV